MDSYPSDGCTTITREVLELGKSRRDIAGTICWVDGGPLGLHNIIGLNEKAKEAVIASTPEEFIDKAVALGTDELSRTECCQGGA